MIITTKKEMRPRDPADFYPTPLALCRAALGLLPPNIAPTMFPATNPLIFDPGAGTGVWGKAARDKWPDAEIGGCDIRDLPCPSDYNCWLPTYDFLSRGGESVDLVMGNPPYKFAEKFCRKALALTREGGYALFLLRLAYLEGQARSRGFWRDFPPCAVHVLSARPSFITEGFNAGKTDATAYAIFLWRKGYKGLTTLDWLDWKPITASQEALI